MGALLLYWQTEVRIADPNGKNGERRATTLAGGRPDGVQVLRRNIGRARWPKGKAFTASFVFHVKHFRGAPQKHLENPPLLFSKRRDMNMLVIPRAGFDATLPAAACSLHHSKAIDVAGAHHPRWTRWGEPPATPVAFILWPHHNAKTAIQPSQTSSLRRLRLSAFPATQGRFDLVRTYTYTKP
jgi:hypothetical protein